MRSLNHSKHRFLNFCIQTFRNKIFVEIVGSVFFTVHLWKIKVLECATDVELSPWLTRLQIEQASCLQQSNCLQRNNKYTHIRTNLNPLSDTKFFYCVIFNITWMKLFNPVLPRITNHQPPLPYSCFVESIKFLTAKPTKMAKNNPNEVSPWNRLCDAIKIQLGLDDRVKLEMHFDWKKIYQPMIEAKFNMEYEIESLDADDYCSITSQGDYFVQFCNPPLPTLVADNATLGKNLTGCFRPS